MNWSVGTFPRAAVERAMKVQEVILRAMARKIAWRQAAEILGITDRHMRRFRIVLVPAQVSFSPLRRPVHYHTN